MHLWIVLKEGTVYTAVAGPLPLVAARKGRSRLGKAGRGSERLVGAGTMVVTPKMESPNVDLKQTVNLPKTTFPMKANLPQTEPKMVERWEKEKLYQRIRASRAGRPTY